MSVKYPNYVNLTSSSEEQPNERTPSPPPRKKSLSPPQAPSKSISSKSTHYTSSSSPSESPTLTHVAPPLKLCFVILIKLEPQELPPPQMSPNDPYAQTMDNWPSGPSNPSPPPRVSRPPLERNKADLDTLSWMISSTNPRRCMNQKLKDLLLKFKHKTWLLCSSSNKNTSSSNEAVNVAHGVTTASTQINTANSSNVDNLSDVVIYAFLASQPNSPQLVTEDLQQIHPDDIEEMDLRC
ncbi:hypothetical protein Tco_1002657 [Tanacetum coccineum]|uniref:Uncharacterized protein n=1 Tax=Tanacetum coccineum TaxID=301880 RepID=A0ABQ5F7S3_9ASTR